jgi:putative FmdB family regulatory protein
MPTYEYLCPLGHEFDLFQKMSDKPRAKCPTCGKPATRKISGGAGLVFKGSGFYITDYGKDGKGPRKEESAKSDAPEKSETKAEPSGESKSESSKEPKAESKPAKADKPASKKAKK